MLFFKEDVEPLFGNNYEEYVDWAKNSFIGGEELDILIVKDMLLTGFDAPIAAVMYVKGELETYRYDDPLLYKKFSDQVKETLAEYKASRNDDTCLFQMEKMADDFKRGYSGHHYPACIDNDSDAKAFYGSIENIIAEAIKEVPPELDEAMGMLAIEIKQAISSRAKVDWRFNVAVNKDMQQALDDLI